MQRLCWRAALSLQLLPRISARSVSVGHLLQSQPAVMQTFYNLRQRLVSTSTCRVDEEGRRRRSSREEDKDDDNDSSVYSRFKFLVKQYWYLVIPIHTVLSCSFLGFFYYISVFGIDTRAALSWTVDWAVDKSLLGESWAESLRKATVAGDFAVAYAFYKLVSLLRYALTLGVTIAAIGFLSRRGYVQALPPTSKIVKEVKKKLDD